MNLLDNFKIGREKEDFQIISANIEKGISFKGTNLWILVFAIFIASLGLNVNSTAVIIGAMLVSPLMGPIMGLGFGMAINDLALLRKSASSYLFAAGTGLLTSTLFFIISPLNEAHSEILARTAPNIYDVLIALFGGLAGMLATSSKLKGNVIPGVAIATALMPPLCTAGYGLATLKPEYFFGALFLFLINTVFIALATLLTTRFFRFPYKHLPEPKDEVKARRIVWGIVLITLLPSIYFGYNLVQENNFQQKATSFIEYEAAFPNDFILQKNIDAKHKVITLTFGGDSIAQSAIEKLKSKLPHYQLQGTQLIIHQGFTYLQKDNTKQTTQFSLTLAEKDNQIQGLRHQLDSVSTRDLLCKQIFTELKVQYPSIESFLIQQAFNQTDSTLNMVWVSNIHSAKKIDSGDKTKITEWLKVRINSPNLILHFETE